MRIPRGQIEQLDKPILWQGRIGDLGIDELGDPETSLTAELGASPELGGIRLRGSVRGTLGLTCDRCLGPLELAIDGTVNVLVIPDGALVKAKLDTARPDVGLIELPPHVGSVDLVAPLREALYLELPQKQLCRSDCKGLCPTCGQNLNEGQCDCDGEPGDDRWASLQKLKEKLEQA